MWEAFVTLNIVMILFMIGWCLLWLWSLVDILSSTFDDTMVKVIWLLVILFLPLIGAILYLLIGRTMKESATSNEGFEQVKASIDFLTTYDSVFLKIWHDFRWA